MKEVEEHLRSLLRVGGLRKGLMVWLGVIPILLGVEAVVVVGYRGIRACLERVDRTVPGGNGNMFIESSLELGQLQLFIRYRFTDPFDSALLDSLESFGQVPTQSATHNDNLRRIGQNSVPCLYMSRI
jgi:hypothetical protein